MTHSAKKISPFKFSLAVQYASNAQLMPTRAQLRRWIKATLRREAIIALRIVDEREGRNLNSKYRGKDYATNVLTFVYDDKGSTPQLPLSGRVTGSSPDKTTSHSTRPSKDDSQVAGYDKGMSGVTLSGDVVICAPVVEREAREQRKELLAHYAHLAIHATLHLQGYDHERAADAAEMESRETAIMLKLGYADPYQGVVS